MEKYDVLFIDDDDQYIYLMERVIKKLNSKFAFSSAINGQVALNLLNDRLTNQLPFPKLIFVDLNMPIMDGFTFLSRYEELKGKNESTAKNTNVVILTSSFNEKDRNRAMTLKVAHDYLIKPIELKTIESFILGLAL